MDSHYLTSNICTTLSPYFPSILTDICVGYLDEHDIEKTIYVSNEWSKFSENEVCDIAAKNGWLDLFKWAINNNCPLNRNTIYFAAVNGRREIIEWAWGRTCRTRSNYLKKNTHGRIYTILKSFAYNLYDVLYYTLLPIQGMRKIEHYQANIDEFPNENDLLFARSEDLGPWGLLCDGAAECGDLKMMKWAYNRFCSITSETYNIAAMKGHHHITAWMDNMQIRFTSREIMLQFIRQQ